MTDAPYILGLYISRCRDVCNDLKVVVDVVRKSDDGRSIRGVSDSSMYQFPKPHNGRNYDSLCMRGQVYQSSEGREWIAYDPRYHSVYCIELREAEVMVKTLRQLESAKKRWREVNGYQLTPVNMFCIFARFVGAQFVVYQDDTKPHGTYHTDRDWEFLSIGEGATRYACELEYVLANWHDRYKPRLVSGGA